MGMNRGCTVRTSGRVRSKTTPIGGILIRLILANTGRVKASRFSRGLIVAVVNGRLGMTPKPEVMEIEEASLRFATSGIIAGVNKKRDAMRKGADSEEAHQQGASQALGNIHSSGADREEIAEHLVDQYWLLKHILREMLTEDEYAEFVEG